MIKEIGSEYWVEKNNDTINNTEFFKWGKDRQFVLSGRTAIEYVIREIKQKRDIKTVYMPSYCCDSMVKPFTNNNICVIFYKVYFDNGLKYEIDKNLKCDIFFAMNYFGFSNDMEQYIKEYKTRNTIIIEDATHSLLSQKVFSNYSDYVIASLRKWFPVYTGGIAICLNNEFENKEIESSEELELVNDRKIAMQEKYRYMCGNNDIDKQTFLNRYNSSNIQLDNNYHIYDMDNDSKEILQHIDINECIMKRKKNAQTIYDTLSCNKFIEFMFKYNIQSDVPLFVPVLVNNKYRDKLRKELIGNNIYVPIHWPQIKQCYYSSDIYNTQLSLICDQRYECEEIKSYIDIINSFFKRGDII